jgi:hypothetical protein
MPANTADSSAFGWKSEANLSFFLLLLVFAGFVLPSLGFEKNNSQLYGDIAFSFIVIAGALLAWRDRAFFVLTSFVVVAAIIVRALAWSHPTSALVLWSSAMGLAAILMITAVLLRQVFRPGPVNVMRIQGAIAAYLCLGFGWAHAYHIAALLDPGAFSSTGSSITAASSWANYSFGMLTTVGYQGITPLQPLAHSLGSGEAVTGQLYLAVLVARLVSMQVSSARAEQS